MTKKDIDDLFALLKTALWRDGRYAADIDGVDWEAVRALAGEQCLLGVVADALDRLNDRQCPREEKLRWVGSVMVIERRNLLMNALVGRLFRKFSAMGLTPVLLKGQAFAANCPVPLHRQCGDIDVYFKHRGDCQKAVEWAAMVDPGAARSADNSRDYKHFAFAVEKTEVELHYYMCLFENRRLQRRLQQIIDEEFAECEPNVVEIGGEKIETVPPTLSVIHQLLHISRHLLEAGVGLRQVCDLAVFLDRHCGEVDGPRLDGYLEELELKTVAEALGYIMVNSLGVDAAKVPFGTDRRYAGFILKEIFDGGNFGHKKTEYRDGKGLLTRKLGSVAYFYSRCRLYKPLFPSEAKSYFANKIRLNLRLLLRK